MGRRSKLEPVPFNLDQFAPTLGPAGQIWAKQCAFDHPIPVVAHAVIFVREGVTHYFVATSYAGKIAGSLADSILSLQAGKAVPDVGKLLARLHRDGYRVIYEAVPVAPEPPVERELMVDLEPEAVPPEPAVEPKAAPKKRGRPRKVVTQ